MVALNEFPPTIWCTCGDGMAPGLTSLAHIVVSSMPGRALARDLRIQAVYDDLGATEAQHGRSAAKSASTAKLWNCSSCRREGEDSRKMHIWSRMMLQVCDWKNCSGSRGTRWRWVLGALMKTVAKVSNVILLTLSP